jgi:SNF2 family DNA or RNA helicase
VIIYRFVTEETVEEKIVERAARKLKIDHIIMAKGSFQPDNSKNKMGSNEMISMIRHGA